MGGPAVSPPPLGHRVDLRQSQSGMDVSSLLACEDGNEIGGGIYPHAFFDTTQVMPPGRLDLDIAPARTPLPSVG
jgi:hypothetical protein